MPSPRRVPGDGEAEEAVVVLRKALQDCEVFITRLADMNDEVKRRMVGRSALATIEAALAAVRTLSSGAKEWEPTRDEIDAAASVLVTLADTDKAATWRDGARLALKAARRIGERDRADAAARVRNEGAEGA